MNAITYKPNKVGTVISVMVNGQMVGHIKKTVGGMWHYAPRGSRGYGEIFMSLPACKKSLEAA
jgi:hypothetical protein